MIADAVWAIVFFALMLWRGVLTGRMIAIGSWFGLVTSAVGAMDFLFFLYYVGQIH